LIRNRQRRIQQHAKLAAALERQLTKEVFKFLQKSGTLAVDACSAGKFKKAEADAVNAIKAAKPRMQKRLESMAMEAAKFQQEEFKSHFCLEIKISLGDIYKSALSLWARFQSAVMIKNISETTREIIKRTVNQGLDKGKSNQVIAKEIKERLTGPSAAKRAIRIARTETHNATQRGSYETASQAPIEMEKEWGATEDARTRLTHNLADGQVVAIDKPFTVGGIRMMYPGDPKGTAKEVINCRCVALYWPKGIRP